MSRKNKSGEPSSVETHEIASGVPIPAVVKSSGSPVSSTLSAMRPGDCLKNPIKKTSLGSWYVAARRLGVKVTARAIDAENARIWRTK